MGKTLPTAPVFLYLPRILSQPTKVLPQNVSTVPNDFPCIVHTLFIQSGHKEEIPSRVGVMSTKTTNPTSPHGSHQSTPHTAPTLLRGFCNCCGREVVLLRDEELGESICRECHSFDVIRGSGSEEGK